MSYIISYNILYTIFYNIYVILLIVMYAQSRSSPYAIRKLCNTLLSKII